MNDEMFHCVCDRGSRTLSRNGDVTNRKAWRTFFHELALVAAALNRIIQFPSWMEKKVCLTGRF